MANILKKHWAWLSVLALQAGSAVADEAAHGMAGMMTAANWATPLGVGFGIALAVIAASTAQGRIASAYMEGVSRNPGAQKAMGTQLILSLVFVETLVLFTFAIVFLLMGKM